MDSHPHLTVPARADLGDLAGFARLYRSTAGLVRSVLPRLGVRDAALDDATQDVFIVAYRRRAEFDGERPVEPWLVGIARRVAFRYRRTAARSQRKLAALAEHSELPQREQLSDHLDALQFLGQFLAELREERREVFVLGELYGLTGPEIAARLNIPVDTAYTRLRATRRQLEQTLLRAAGDDPPPASVTIDRAWLVLLPQLGRDGSTSWLLLALAKSKLAIAGVAVAAAVAVIVVGPRPGTTPPAATTTAAPLARREAPHVTQALTPPPASRLEAMLTGPPVERPPTRAGASTSTTAPTSSPTPPAIDPLGAGLLRSALEALAADDPGAALAQLDRHAREFPGSPLAEARDLSRVRALCRLGDTTRAREVAARLRGDGLARDALAGTCVADP